MQMQFSFMSNQLNLLHTSIISFIIVQEPALMCTVFTYSNKTRLLGL